MRKRVLPVTIAEFDEITRLERRCLVVNEKGELECDEAKWKAGLEDILGREMVGEMLKASGKVEWQVHVVEWWDR